MSLATTFKPDSVAATQGNFEQMVPKHKEICTRLIERLIKKVEELEPPSHAPSSDAGSSSPASSSSDIDVVNNERRYVPMKLKIKKKSVPLYVWCLKKNVNNNYPS